MKKISVLILTLAMAALVVSGCGHPAQNTKIQCPKCGSIFTVEEGLKGIGP